MAEPALSEAEPAAATAADSAPTAPAPRRARPSRLRRLARWTERCLAILGVLFGVYHAGFEVTEVVSPSMKPTFSGSGPGEADNDWLLVERISHRFSRPPRWSILQFQTEDGLRVAKRVAGYPGEELTVVARQLRVDGTLLPDAPPVQYLAAGKLRPRRGEQTTYTVEGPGLFVLGDNSLDSWDSRFVGEIKPERWRGRAVAVLWPPSRWSWLW
ncbi:MAG TPA: signal peptidase I [Planctomycetes bacterium]|nr:signal peptidase I [Planctomycetota bacterium]